MAYVYKNPHEQSKHLAEDELALLEQERTQIQQRLLWIEQRSAQLKAYLTALTPLIEHDPGQILAEAGLTRICRDVLTKINRWVTATEVRVLLLELGISIDGYTNPMAVLHSILRRVGELYQDSTGTYYGRKGLLPLLTNPENEQPANFGPPDSLANQITRKMLETKAKKK